MAYPNIEERRLFSRPETPRTASRASGALLTPLCSNYPVTSQGTGSISTSVHTTCKISSSRSRISLCRCIIKPPHIQIVAWSVSNTFPQTHTVGMSLNSQPYLSLIASLNSLLLRMKFISFNGITLSQLKAPFCFINSTARWIFKGR